MLPRFLRTFILVALAIIALCSFVVIHPSTKAYVDPFTNEIFGNGGFEPEPGGEGVDKAAVRGGVIMGKLENGTAKAELGRATWRLLHTMTLRFPDTPTADERAALRSYFLLQARLYPCGECATEFMALLRKHPPQTSTRMVASLWLCSIHNMVNVRLGKPEFDCSKLDETYDCGCGDETSNSTNPADTGEPEPGMIKGG